MSSSGKLITNADVAGAAQIAYTKLLLTNSLVTGDIVDLAVTTAKLAELAVTAAKLAANAVTTDKILDLNVTSGKLSTDAVTTAKITDLNVTSTKLAANAVTTAKITDLNVTSGKIADSAVTTGKIAAAATTQLGWAEGSSGSVSTTSGTAVTMTDMSVPLTTVGGSLLLLYTGTHYHSAAGSVSSFRFRMDAAGTYGPKAVILPTTHTSFTMMALIFPSAGAHTFTVAWFTNAATLHAANNERYFLVAEIKR